MRRRRPRSSVDSPKVVPVTTIDSPSAISTNSEHRSAMWPPSTFQSCTLERPRPGTRKPSAGETYSMASARHHSHTRVAPPSRPPAIQNGAAKASQSVTRWKLRKLSVRLRRRAASMNRLRPTCIATYVTAKVSPDSPKACGRDVDSTSPASMRTSMSRRTGARSGSSALVTQEV